MKNFNELPAAVQADVKGTLKVFDKCNVYFENGEYSASPHSCLKSAYGADHEFIGEWSASDIFTEKEKQENYINAFMDYPHNYHGKRDYKIFTEMMNARRNGEELHGELNENGDFELRTR